ncbi:MAG: hypothetical protein BBJ57_02145 [Desulfobacterales bacterium PC51MH44]|nr:MAG: hypothetical protein BBJ57_02145 [Desulfobacterales bacterium PC51MH44]
MAVTLDEYTTHSNTVNQGITGFANNAYSADWSGSEEAVAAVAAKHIYITSIAISCSAAINLTVFEGSGGNELWGPVFFLADGGTFASVEFNPPLKIAVNTAVEVDGSGAGAATVMVQGFIS